MFGIDDLALAAIISGVAGAGASLWGSKVQSDAAHDAANTQADAANRAADLQREQFQQQRADLQPWQNVGVNALNQLNTLASNYHPFQFSEQDPGYQFRLKEGLKAIQQSAAARGGLLSGATMKAMNNYAQGSASQEYQNAFNRYQAEREARLNPLQSLAGVGQTATNALGNAGQTYASNVGNFGVGAANALAEGRAGAANATASGYMGATNSLTNALSGYYNNQQSQALLKKLLGQGGNSGSYGGPYAPAYYGGDPYPAETPAMVPSTATGAGYPLGTNKKTLGQTSYF